MYTPAYTLTDRLLNNLVRLETAKTLVVEQVKPGPIKKQLKRRSLSLNMLHAAHELGIDITIKQAEKLATGNRYQTDDQRALLLNNFRSVMEFNRSSMAGSYAEIDVNLIHHLNKLLLTDWRDVWFSKLRTAGEETDLAMETWVEMRDRVVEPQALQSQLIDALDWYRTNKSSINVLIRIAVFLYRFWELSPFIAANKFTGLAIADYLLCKHGYATEAFLPSIRGFDVYADEYLEAWALTKERGDLNIWVERFIRNLGNDMQGVKDEFYKQQQEEKQVQQQPFLDLNKRQLKILRYLQTIPSVQREEYCQMMDVSTMTAFRDLSDLVRKKLVKKEGRGRGTKYVLYNR